MPASGVYQERSAFLNDVFVQSPPPQQALWLTGDVQDEARNILGHNYPGLRIRYWHQQVRSAWILEEVGKEKPITVGLVVNDGTLELIRVLAFRESRGWEVRYPFFTEQFVGASIRDDRMLDRRIDGITGATLSVRAVKKLARLALYLHTQIPSDNVTPTQ